MNLYERCRKPIEDRPIFLNPNDSIDDGDCDVPADVDAFEFALHDFFIASFNIQHSDRFKIIKDVFSFYSDGRIDYVYYFIVKDVVIFDLSSLMPDYNTEYVAAFDYLEDNKEAIQERMNIVRFGQIMSTNVIVIRGVEYTSPFLTEPWHNDE